MCVCVSHSVMLTLWTVACQAPLSMEPPGKATGVGRHSLLQESPALKADSLPSTSNQ